MKRYSIVTIMVLVLAGMAQATVWYVHPDSTLNSIQTALNLCSTNDTVLVGPGTYTENITWPNTGGIDLVSELGPESTFIDGDSSGRVIDIYTADTATLIKGLTIRNGYAYCGGGIFLTGASPTIMSNIITGNVSYSQGGGGIFCNDDWYHGSSPIIIDNILTNNWTGTNGGGIGCYNAYASSSPQIINNYIAENHAENYGGGIRCGAGCTAYIRGNTVLNNIAWGGGGIELDGSAACIVDSNTVIDNHATVWGGGICIVEVSDMVLVENNLLRSNVADSGGGGIVTVYSPHIIIQRNNIDSNTSYWIGGGIGALSSGGLIENNTIKNNHASDYGGAIVCSLSTFMIDSCTISQNSLDAIYCAGSSGCLVIQNNFSDNIGFAMRNSSASVINATYNWWGDASGPYHSTNPGGLGDTVSDYVDFNPWLLGPGISETEELLIENQHSRIIMPTILSGSILPFTVRQRCEMSIKLYDLAGRECWATEKAIYEIGSHTINLPKLSNGIYFIKFAADEQQETRKVLFVR